MKNNPQNHYNTSASLPLWESKSWAHKAVFKPDNNAFPILDKGWPRPKINPPSCLSFGPSTALRPPAHIHKYALADAPCQILLKRADQNTAHYGVSIFFRDPWGLVHHQPLGFSPPLQQLCGYLSMPPQAFLPATEAGKFRAKAQIRLVIS